MPAAFDVALGVLAGGRSTRMGGVPKGTVPFLGRALIEHVLAHTQRFEFSEVLISTRDAASYARYGHRLVADRTDGLGAPGAVSTLLHATRAEWLLVLACDMPIVAPAAIELLFETASQEPTSSAFAFEVAGRLEPLLGLYRTQAASQFEACVGAKGCSFQKLFNQLPGRVLPESALAAVDPTLRSVIGVNSPEALQALERSSSRA